MVFIAIAGFSAIARSVMIFAGMELVSFDLGTGFSAIARSVMIFADGHKGFCMYAYFKFQCYSS